MRYLNPNSSMSFGVCRSFFLHPYTKKIHCFLCQRMVKYKQYGEVYLYVHKGIAEWLETF